MRRLLCWSAVALVGVVLAMPACQAAIHEYQPVLMLALPYGDELGMLGLAPDVPGESETEEGASLYGLAAPVPDVVYLLDQVQGKVKRVSAGQIAPVMDMPGNIWSVCAMPSERMVYSLGQWDLQPAHLAVYDTDGTEVQGAGQSIWDQAIAQVTLAGPPWFTVAGVDATGEIFLSAAPIATEGNETLIRYGADLVLQRTLPGHSVGWDGLTQGLQSSGGPKSNDRLARYTRDGGIASEALLRPPEECSQGDYDPVAHEWQALPGLFVDCRGEIYVVREPERTPDQYVRLGEGVTIRQDLVIYKFDSAGTFLVKLVLPGMPFYATDPLAVDLEGNLYHVVHYADHAELVKECLVITSALAPRACAAARHPGGGGMGGQMGLPSPPGDSGEGAHHAHL